MLSLFRRRITQRNWDDITLEKFYKLSKLGKSPNVYDVIDIVYDINCRELPIKDVPNYKIDFLNTTCPKRPIKKHYVLNGTKYNALFDITRISAAQFVDFRNYAATGAKLEDILSVCLIPEGHTYNDGYDIQQLKKDILQLPITDVQTISFFFINQLFVLLESIQSSLTSNLETMKTEETMKLKSLLENLDLPYLMSSQFC